MHSRPQQKFSISTRNSHVMMKIEKTMAKTKQKKNNRKENASASQKEWQMQKDHNARETNQ